MSAAWGFACVCTHLFKHHSAPQLAVAVLPSLFVTEGKTLQEASDEMAYQLLRQWGIGNKSCHDGLVLMFVKNHLIVSLAGRENVVPGYISPLFVSFLRARLSLMYLTSGSVGAALLSGVDLVSSQLPRASTGMGWVTFLLLCLVLAYIASVVVVYFVLSYSLSKRFAGGD
ncbi:hypothetical protein Efla_006157 [Eimeria flavescens]